MALSGSKMLIILMIINVGLVMLAPSTFLEENESFTRIASTFGINFNTTVTDPTGTYNYTIIGIGDNETAGTALGLTTNDTSGSISTIVRSYFSPLLFILDFIKLMFAFAFAPITIMSALGAPWYVRLMFGFPMVVLYVLAIAGWLRGVKF